MKHLPRFVFAACLLPLAWLGWRFAAGDLGANPISTLLNELGFYAFLLLMLTLACTPVQLVFRQSWPLRIRKVLGDFAFFYACLHLTTWAVLDQGLDWADIRKDLVKRRFIFIGAATWLLLLPLAITSTKGWMKRLGFRRWKALHRLVYLAGCLACIHFVWRFKTAMRTPLAWTAVFVLLMGVRIFNWMKRGRLT